MTGIDVDRRGVRIWAIPVAAGAVTLVGCTGSSNPPTPGDPLTVRVAHMCGLNPADLTYYGDKAGFAGPNYTWTLIDGSELVVYARLSPGYRLSCPDGRNFPLHINYGNPDAEIVRADVPEPSDRLTHR